MIKSGLSPSPSRPRSPRALRPKPARRPPPAAAAAQAQQPDFSGLWFPAGRQQDPQRPEYTPPAQAALADYEKAFTLDDDPGRYCQWPGMPRAVWGAPFTVEIQQRPQDITIYWEGYGMYRKIYMADHNPPEPILPSAMGHSVAHWEGATLVIETTNLKPYPYMTRMATSSDATVVERMRVEERDVNGQKTKFIVNELVLTDPEDLHDADQDHGESSTSAGPAAPRVHLLGCVVGRVLDRARPHAARHGRPAGAAGLVR